MAEQRVCFLILNYNTPQETQNCIKSIFELDSEGFSIEVIVVDNGSDDNSYEKLKKIYEADKRIQVIATNKNTGFSAGNNFGYKAIRNRESLRYLIVCNSDILFEQKEILKFIQQSFEKDNCEIISPDVFCQAQVNTALRGHQSPAYPWECTRFDAIIKNKNAQVRRQKSCDAANRVKKFSHIAEYYFIRGVFAAQWVIQNVLKSTLYRSWRMVPHKDICGHGSCIILTQPFLEKENVIFEPETFLYYEELLLSLRAKQKGMRWNYNPVLKVTHLQGVATNKQKENEFVSKFMYESGKIYMREINKKKTL